MKQRVSQLAVLCLVLVSFCCIPSFTAEASPKLKSVALVSLSVSDVAGTVRVGSIGRTSVSKLMAAEVNGMLTDAEKKLSKKWTVVKAASFINNAKYRKLGVKKTLSVYVPKIKGREMPVFTQESKEIKHGIIGAGNAKALCKTLKVDGVVVIFSEWTSKVGHFVPTTKAYTKNILTVWDSTGDMVINKRVDMVGKRTLGASGIKAVNKETIKEWRSSYDRSLDKILKSL